MACRERFRSAVMGVDVDNLHRLGPSGSTLTIEERAGLQVAMLERQKEENFNTRPLFWGKILGELNDYLIVYVLITENVEFPVKKFFYTTTGTYVLKQLPDLTEDYISKAKAINSRFKGDPSFPLEGGTEAEEGEENPTNEKFREIHRLTYTVQLIDHDASIVPRGAVYLDASHKVKQNRAYEGLSFASAENLKSYLHFRKPESTFARVAFEKEGLARAGDFLDSIDDDKPKGIWSTMWDPSHTSVTLRSLYWPGYFFYHLIGTHEFGDAYFGYGTKNTDIAFML